MSPATMGQLCEEVVESLLGRELDYRKAKELTTEAKFSEGDVQGGTAALGFILRSATRHATDPASLESELQQLGLPRELALALTRCHEQSAPRLVKHFADCSLRLSRLGRVEWRVDAVAAGGEQDTPRARLRLGVEDTLAPSPEGQSVSLSLTPDQLNTLIADLKIAHGKMQELESTD